ncbi:MAG: isoleucine--tRNA ligase [Candidatus Aenigmatarchaeota archaeon]
MNELEIKEYWKKQKIYEKARKRKGRKFYFLDGPPYATGSIHMGTAWNKILKDCYIRFLRMSGYSVWDQPGYDTHGLPIENKVEKELGMRSKADIERIGVEKFVLECRKFATKYIDIMNGQFDDLGVWMDWSNPYLTLTNDYIEGAWHTFKIAYEKGLLYHGLYPVHVCPHCETAVAYNEIEYKKVSDPSVFVKFQVKNGNNTFLVIWTTTPWTLPANTGIMVNPNAEYVKVKTNDETLILANERLSAVMEKIGCVDYHIVEKITGIELENLEYEHPLKDIFSFLKDVKHRVVLSEQFVSLEEGTGLVHTAPGHGQEDYRVGKEKGLSVISPVNLKGVYNEECGEYAGMFVKSADRKILDELKNRGLLLHEEKVVHDYPMCWRCDSPLLQLSVPQWFFAVTKMRKKLRDENKKVNWYPDWAKNRFDNWLENLSDWPISRQRYWGIPLPIWRCECGATKVIGSRKELPRVPKDFHRPYIDKIEMKCRCGKKMKRIPDVLDVWFDSGLASWASLGYPKNKALFKKMWPSDFQTEGPDQIRGWWNSQLITSVITFDRAPFKNILFHGFVLDAHGIKMSKSKGNVVTPDEIVKKYSRDILRLYLLSSPPWDDFYFSWNEIADVAKAFIIMENSFNFVKTYGGKGKKKKLMAEDRWLLSRLNSLIESCTKNLEEYNGHKAAVDIRDFTVNDFSRWYIKIIRDRVWIGNKKDDAALHTLYEVSKSLATLLAPFCPLFSEYVYRNILKEKKSVHLCDWPKPNKKMIDRNLEEKMTVAKKVVELVNTMRKENNIKLKWPLKEIIITKNLSGLECILRNMCNVKNIGYGESRLKVCKEFDNENVFLNIEMDESLREEALLREVIRKVQEMRKNEKLVIKDEIILTLNGCDEMKKFEKEIMNEVGAKKVLFGKVSGKTDELAFDDRKIVIGIEKI